MAKVTAADFMNPKDGGWAAQVRREYQERINSRKEESENNAARLAAILEALRNEGATEDTLAEVARQYTTTGESEQLAAEPQPVLPVEEAPVPQERAGLGDLAYRVSTAAPRTLSDAVMGEGFFDAMVDTAQGGLQRSARAALGRLSESDNPRLKLLAELPGAAMDVATGNGMSALERASVGGVVRDMAGLAEASQANVEAASGARERLGSRNWLVRNLGEGALDAAASPSGAASLIGGPLGAVAMLDAYDQAYQQAVDAGVDSDEDRELWALSQAAPELVSFIPASKVVQRLPVIGKAVERLVKKPLNNLAAKVIEREGSPALKAAMRTVNTALGEGIEEGFTGGMQDIAAGSVAQLASGDLSELARANVSSTFGGAEENGTFADTLWESARAGFVMGGGLSAVPNVARSYDDRARFIDERSTQTEQDILAGAANVQLQPVDQPVLPSTEVVQPDMFSVPSDAPSFEEQEAQRQRSLEEEAAWTLRNRERDEEQQAVRREELRNSYVARVDNARQEVESLQDRIEAGAVDSATLNAATEAQRNLAEAENNLRSLDESFSPRQEQPTVSAEPAPVVEPAQRDFIAEQQEQERVRQINDVARRRESVAKKAAAQAAKEQKKADTASRALRNKAIDSLFAEGLSDAEVVDQLPARIAQLQAPAPKPEAPAPEPSTRKVSEPKAPVDDIAKLKQSSDPHDRAQAEVLERFGKAAPEAQPSGDYRERVRKIARSLAGDSSRRAAAVEGMLKQGKMVVVPNASTLGRDNVERAGEYDPNTGTTYLYTDYLGDNDLADIMNAAAHESTHLGQFSGREARDEKLKALLGEGGVQEGARKLRAAATKGNKFAQEALRAAQADTASRNGDNQYEDLELVAYAVGNDAEGRTTTLGSAAGALRDLVSGAKSQLRNKLGLDLDISVNDLRAAMGQVLQEAEATTPQQTEGVPLGMIYNVRPNRPTEGQLEAVRKGNVYNSVDGTQKFVLSDSDSYVDREALAALADNPGISIKLGEVMEHPVLYRERPAAYNIDLVVSDKLGNGVMGRYHPGRRLIELAPDIARNSDPMKPTAREIVMHEVQHFVQDVDGRSEQFYEDTNSASQVRSQRTKVDRAETAYNLAIDILLENAPKQTRGEVQQQINDVLALSGMKDWAKAIRVNQILQEAPRIPVWLRPMVEDFVQTRDAYNKQADEYNKLLTKTHADYMSNIAEREAHFTQYNIDAGQRELDAQGNPEPVMREQEAELDSGVDATGGRIDVPQGDGTVAALSQPSYPSRKIEVMDIISSVPFYRGSTATGNVPRVTDGALGPGHYVTSDIEAARGYGPNVAEFEVDSASPLVLEMADVAKFEGNTARALVENEAFWKENFNTKGGAIRWANEQWEDWAGIGDPEFPAMLRDAGFDSVALMNGSTVVELNVPTRRQLLPPSASNLGMAARQRRGGAFRNKNKVTTFLTAAIRNDKGLGAHVRNEVELAKAAPVEFEAKANRAAGQYDGAVKVMAKQRGMSPADLNKEIRDKLEAIADMPGSASEYRAAFNAIADEYGDAGKALKRLRGLVDDLSTEFIRTYLDSGAKLTKKEKDDVKKVAANLGRYVHRFYASRLGRGAGEMYSQAVQDAVDKAQKKGVKSLTPKQKELHDRYVNAAKVILDGVMIPDAESIADIPNSQLDYLYDTWFGTDQTGMTPEEKAEALLQRREEIGPDQLQQKVEAASQALLWGAEANAATRYYDRGEKLDTTIMQKRSRIPKEIRDLMGEVVDPAGALLTTVSKQAEFVSRTKLMFALRDMASPNDLQPPGSAGSRLVRENNMTELTGEGFGPLRGYYASPSMRAMIDDTAESLMNFTEAMATNSGNGEVAIKTAGRAIAELWMKGASGAKAINIVGNLFRYPLNFLGSFAMLGVNGNLNVKSYGRGLSDAVDIIRYAGRPSQGLGRAELASKYRVVDSATVGDLKLLDLGKIEQVVRGMSGKNPGTFLRKARELRLAGRETYAMMDVWSKIANFHAEADFLRSLYKAEGLSKTDDEIYREASAIVNNTNMSYSRTLPLLKTIERGGITQYAPYLYEAHRVVFANLRQGLGEIVGARNMANPKAKAILAARGTARVAGTASVLSMLGYFTNMMAGMWGDDEEDKRALLPEYARVMDFLNIGVDEQGKPILWAASNLDPLGPITDLYRAARLGDQPMEALWNQFKDNYIMPSLGPAAWDAVARTTGLLPTTTSRPRKPLVQQWSDDGWSAVVGITGKEDALASIMHLIETRYAPGTVRGWSESNPVAAGSDIDSVAYNMARAIGARGIRYDPKVGATNAYFDYDGTMKEARRSLAAYVENTTNPSAEEITKRLLTLRQEEKDKWDQLATVYRGLVAVDMDEAEAQDMLKEVGVPKAVIRQVVNEEFTSSVVNEQSLKTAAKLQIGKAKTDSQKEQLEEKWNTAMEILNELEAGN